MRSLFAAATLYVIASGAWAQTPNGNGQPNVNSCVSSTNVWEPCPAGSGGTTNPTVTSSRPVTVLDGSVTFAGGTVKQVAGGSSGVTPTDYLFVYNASAVQTVSGATMIPTAICSRTSVAPTTAGGQGTVPLGAGGSDTFPSGNSPVPNTYSCIGPTGYTIILTVNYH